MRKGIPQRPLVLLGTMSGAVANPSPPGASARATSTARWTLSPWAKDEADRNRFWRRTIHVAGALVLLYFVIPGNFGYLPWPSATTVTILLLLEAALILELLRQFGRIKVPLTRPYEEGRIAAYTWYAISLSIAILVFPEAIAVGVVLGVAIVDPLIGELRLRGARPAYPYVPFAVYLALVFSSLLGVGNWRLTVALPAAFAAAVLAIAAERPRLRFLDDDLLMTLVPATFLWAVLTLWPAGVVG